MNGRNAASALVLASGMLLAGSALAVPSLQLDIVGGSYDVADESTVTNNSNFDLLALGLVGTVSTSNNYYLSIALTPAALSDVANLGNVKVNGTALSSLGVAEYGTPPVDASVHPDLPSHGIYDTFYYELMFNFGLAPQISAYNSADGSAAAGMLFKQTFTVDASALSSGYGLHFDLYTYGADKNKVKVTDFAPFSHDAAYCLSGSCDPSTEVPEPASLTLLGLGMLALGLRRRKAA